MEKIAKEKRDAFVKILEKIDGYHKQFDEILKGTTDVEKAFILGSYVWDLNMKSRKK